MSNTIKHRYSSAIAITAVTLFVTGAVMAASELPTAGQLTDKRPLVDGQSLDFGAYDPHGDFGSATNVKIEHLFLPWEDVDLTSLSAADDYAMQRGRSLLITVEPWSWSGDRSQPSGQLLKGILEGRYDGNMGAICSAAAELKSSVTIRWAQEMDEPNGQFTWSSWAPKDYVAAYRRMVTECRKHTTTAKYMWSPKGTSTLTSFYPGDDVVDSVGLSVFGLQKYDNDKSGRDLTFSEILEPGYRLAAAFRKPIIVAELGYEGDQTYVNNWAKTVANRTPDFPLLTAVVYFNDREVYPWPKDYGRPNWRVVEPIVN